MAAVDEQALATGRRFIDAIVAHDWDRIAACFEPDATFRGLVPKATPLRERTGGDEAAAQMRAWFGDADVTQLLTSTVERMHDRIHLAYQIREHEPDGWYLVEQQAYITPGENGIAYMNLLCSGFRPVPE